MVEEDANSTSVVDRDGTQLDGLLPPRQANPIHPLHVDVCTALTYDAFVLSRSSQVTQVRDNLGTIVAGARQD